jgi:hypothetical protein
MSLHSTYNEKERHWAVTCLTRLQTSAFFEVRNKAVKASVSATGTAFRPLENPCQQLSFRNFPDKPKQNRKSRHRSKPSTPCKTRKKQPTAVAVTGETPKRPAAGSGHLGHTLFQRNPNSSQKMDLADYRWITPEFSRNYSHWPAPKPSFASPLPLRYSQETESRRLQSDPAALFRRFQRYRAKRSQLFMKWRIYR